METSSNDRIPPSGASSIFHPSSPPHCVHCPFAGRGTGPPEGEGCPRWPTNHVRYCEWVDPSAAAYKPHGAAALIAIAARRAGLPPGPREAGNFPPMLVQAGNLAGAVVRSVASGLARANPELKAERLAICNGCREFADGRCRLCGCRLGLKVAMQSEHCPIAKW